MTAARDLIINYLGLALFAGVVPQVGRGGTLGGLGWCRRCAVAVLEGAGLVPQVGWGGAWGGLG